jgi:hypothetical protein
VVAAVALLSNSLARSTYASYDNALRQFCIFCTEENIAPLQATPATMVRYTTWLALVGTVAASSLQPYFSAVNKFFRDNQRQPIAVGELLADARRGLEMLQHRLLPTLLASRFPPSSPSTSYRPPTLYAVPSHGHMLPFPSCNASWHV